VSNNPDIESSEVRSGVVVNRDAPAIKIAEIIIEAPVETVWGVLSDLDGWPSWNKGVSKIHVSGPVRAGTSFEWMAGGAKIKSRLEEVTAPKKIAWSGKMFGIRAIHVWELEGQAYGTKVHTEESFEGPVARLFRGFARRTLARALDQSTQALKAEAESRKNK